MLAHTGLLEVKVPLNYFTFDFYIYSVCVCVRVHSCAYWGSQKENFYRYHLSADMWVLRIELSCKACRVSTSICCDILSALDLLYLC